MALCLMIVAGSVLFGVFGPSIAQRSMLGGGVSIGELLANAIVFRDQLLWHALDLEHRAPNDARRRTPNIRRDTSSDDDPSNASDAGAASAPGAAGGAGEASSAGTGDDGASKHADAQDRLRTLRAGAATAISRLVGDHATIPDLSGVGYELSAWSAVSLRGGRDDSVALGYLDSANDGFVALFLTSDDGHFVVFDGLGRAIPLLPDRLFAEDVPRAPREDAVALVWSTGPMLMLAIIDSSEQAAALRSALGAP